LQDQWQDFFLASSDGTSPAVRILLGEWQICVRTQAPQFRSLFGNAGQIT
jgi:hypothetical protein